MGVHFYRNSGVANNCTETFLIKGIIAIGTILWVFLMWMIVKLSKPYSKLVETPCNFGAEFTS